MKLLHVSAATAALVMGAAASPALAQDSWSGGYIGVYGGAAMADDQGDETLLFDRNLDGNFNEQVSTAAGANAFGPGFCDGSASGNNAAAGCSSDDTGVEGGIRAGYDWQFGSFVVGGVAEIGGADIDDNTTGFSVTPAAYVVKSKLESLAAVRARVGYAFGPALIYGTGGYAAGKVENRFFTTNVANSFSPTVDDDEADGWQAGGGVEYRLAQNLSVTGEYLYSSLDTGDYVIRVGQGTALATNPFILPPNTTGTDLMRSNDKFEVHSFRIGMNYRF